MGKLSKNDLREMLADLKVSLELYLDEVKSGKRERDDSVKEAFEKEIKRLENELGR
ncbi:MAG: hypothetical protein QG567_1378 [Campylobacterota bacterium]|nr:hypothetical protein [Campylobacterota bacterium]